MDVGDAGASDVSHKKVGEIMTRCIILSVLYNIISYRTVLN